jgi:protein O-mannosyl-transferase
MSAGEQQSVNPPGAEGAVRRRLCGERRGQVLACSAALLMVALVYANSLSNAFVWDDQKLIVNDRAVKSWRHLSEVFTSDFFERNEDDLPYGYYRPATTISYLVDFSFYGLHPYGYHLTNVLLHAACTALVAIILLCLEWGTLASGVAAVLFAVHPIHTENVAWIAGRTDLLAFFFCAVALMAEVMRGGPPRWAPRHRSSPPRHLLLAIVGPCAFALAMLAKEMSVVFVAWLALVEWLAYLRPWPAIGWRLLPYFAVVTAYATWRFFVIQVPLPGAPPEHHLGSVLLSAAPTVLRYLEWLAWPTELNAYVQNPYVTQLSDGRLLLSWAMLLGLGLVGSTVASRSPRVALAAAMLAVSFVPILNFVRVAAPPDMGNVMAERFCYFPSFPFLALVGFGAAAVLHRALRSPAAVVVGAALLTVVVGAAAVTTVRRNRDWSDELTFLNRTLEQSPTAVLLWGNLATYHLRKRNLDAAAGALMRAAALDPENYAVLSAQALLHVISGQPADAIPLQERIVANAHFGKTVGLNNLAYLYRITGRHDEAQGILEGLIVNGHGYADVYLNLAEIWRARGNVDEARRQYWLALGSRPQDVQIAGALAGLERDAGRLDAAEALYRDLATAYPDDARVLNNWALLRYDKGDTAGALEVLKQAVGVEPDYVNGRMNYAQLLEQSGRVSEAATQLEEAVRAAESSELRVSATQKLEALRARSGTPPQASSAP